MHVWQPKLMPMAPSPQIAQSRADDDDDDDEVEVEVDEDEKKEAYLLVVVFRRAIFFSLVVVTLRFL